MRLLSQRLHLAGTYIRTEQIKGSKVLSVPKYTSLLVSKFVIAIDFAREGKAMIGEMLIFPICVMNLGREDVIIVGCEVRYENGKLNPGAYDEPGAMLGRYGERKLPKKLAPGETLQLEQLTRAAFRQDNWPKEIVILDAEGNEFKINTRDLEGKKHAIERYKNSEDRIYEESSAQLD